MNLIERCRFRPPEKGILIIWEITNFCNLQCLHCCTNSGPNVSTLNDVKTERIKAIIREFTTSGVKVVYFSGGEPFLRKDFMDLLETIDTTKTDIAIASNGYAIDSKTANRLKDINFKQITISLDGHTAEIHNAVRGRADAFSRAVAGIRACVSAKIPIRVSGTITSSNLNYIQAFVDFVVSLGVRELVLNTALPAGRAMENIQLIPSEQSKEIALEQIVKIRDSYSEQIKIDYSFNHNLSPAPVGCPGGKQVLHITADGQVSPCSWLYKIDKNRFSIGNIKHDSLTRCMEQSDIIMKPLLEKTGYCPIPYVHS